MLVHVAFGARTKDAAFEKDDLGEHHDSECDVHEDV